VKLRGGQRGCLIGLAAGEALGAAVEFSAPGTFSPVTGYRAGGLFGLAAGEWTDDTSMSLALAALPNDCSKRQLTLSAVAIRSLQSQFCVLDKMCFTLRRNEDSNRPPISGPTKSLRN
jgi:ADP-ribosylglycohydrolase